MAGMALTDRWRPLLAASLWLATGLSSGVVAKESSVTSRLRIEDHFTGANLALAQAAAADDAAQVRSLIRERGADPNAVSPKGLALIAWPLLKDAPRGVEALLSNGSDPNRELASVGPAIVLAAKSEDPAMLRAFLDHGGNPNAMSSNLEPLTIVAQMASRWSNVQLLIERGADINTIAHGDPGDTVLAFYSAGQFDKVEWLLAKGADPAARIDQSPKPERIGAQPIVENIYWWPVDAMRFPVLAQAQRRCQDYLAKQLKIYAPQEPAHLAKLRQSQQSGGSPGATSRTRALDPRIAESEARIRAQLRQ